MARTVGRLRPCLRHIQPHLQRAGRHPERGRRSCLRRDPYPQHLPPPRRAARHPHTRICRAHALHCRHQRRGDPEQCQQGRKDENPPSGRQGERLRHRRTRQGKRNPQGCTHASGRSRPGRRCDQRQQRAPGIRYLTECRANAIDRATRILSSRDCPPNGSAQTAAHGR